MKELNLVLANVKGHCAYCAPCPECKKRLSRQNGPEIQLCAACLRNPLVKMWLEAQVVLGGLAQ